MSDNRLKLIGELHKDMKDLYDRVMKESLNFSEVLHGNKFLITQDGVHIMIDGDSIYFLPDDYNEDRLLYLTKEINTNKIRGLISFDNFYFLTTEELAYPKTDIRWIIKSCNMINSYNNIIYDLKIDNDGLPKMLEMVNPVSYNKIREKKKI